MKKKLLRGLFLMLYLPSALLGLIVETKDFSDVVAHVNETTLVLLDLDNTLIESEPQLGSNAWQEYIRSACIAEGYSKEEAGDLLDSFWRLSESFISKRLVEPTVPISIAKMQERALVLILTARDSVDKFFTFKQLASFGLSFSRPGFSPRSLPTLHVSYYEKGVLFSGCNPSKGDTLKGFLTAFGYRPEKIVFVDDSMSRIIEVEKAAKELAIEYVGIHYTKASDRPFVFEPEIASFQFRMLPKLFSDEEAREQINNGRASNGFSSDSVNPMDSPLCHGFVSMSSLKPFTLGAPDVRIASLRP